MITPDLIEPLVGYRWWKYRSGRLEAPYYNTIWEPGVNTAKCMTSVRDIKKDIIILEGFLNPGSDDLEPEIIREAELSLERLTKLNDPPPHAEPPHPLCDCGLYAYNTLNPLRSHRDHVSIMGGLQVYGSVEMWGRVEAYESGYRAEHARVKAISYTTRFSSNYKALKSLADSYQVPLISFEELDKVER